MTGVRRDLEDEGDSRDESVPDGLEEDEEGGMGEFLPPEVRAGDGLLGIPAISGQSRPGLPSGGRRPEHGEAGEDADRTERPKVVARCGHHVGSQWHAWFNTGVLFFRCTRLAALSTLTRVCH